MVVRVSEDVFTDVVICATHIIFSISIRGLNIPVVWIVLLGREWKASAIMCAERKQITDDRVLEAKNVLV